MTWFAVIKFRPRPPARVDNMKIVRSEPGWVKSWMYYSLSSSSVEPSSLQNLYSLIVQKSSKMSSKLVKLEKSKTCSPFALIF